MPQPHRPKIVNCFIFLRSLCKPQISNTAIIRQGSLQLNIFTCPCNFSIEPVLQWRWLPEHCKAVRARQVRASAVRAHFGRRQRETGHCRLEGARQVGNLGLRRRPLLPEVAVCPEGRDLLRQEAERDEVDAVRRIGHCLVHQRFLLVRGLLFCSSGFPLARTRWVWSKISSHSSLPSNQCCWLTSTPLIIFPLIFLGDCWNSNTRLASMLRLCHAAPFVDYSISVK